MGLFSKKKKKNSDDGYFSSGSFESADASDDAFLVSAVSSGGISDDVFETSDEVLDKTRGYGSNSGLAYVNKYSATNQKLATTKVVDVGVFKKPVKEVPKPVESEKGSAQIPLLEKDKDKKDDVLLEPLSDDEEESDFDSFFEEFMKKTADKEKEQKVEEKKIEDKKVEPIKETPKIEVKSKVVSKPAVKKPRKRAIDIDIISGGVGGDII